MKKEEKVTNEKEEIKETKEKKRILNDQELDQVSGGDDIACMGQIGQNGIQTKKWYEALMFWK